VVFRTRLKTVGERVFDAAAVHIWNNLLPTCCQCPLSISVFKKHSCLAVHAVNSLTAPCSFRLQYIKFVITIAVVDVVILLLLLIIINCPKLCYAPETDITLQVDTLSETLCYISDSAIGLITVQ